MKRPVVLTVAGSDPSGGAGIQADLKTFAAQGVYGAAVITLLSVQNTQGVRRVAVLDAELVAEQLSAVLEDLPVAAVKTGALGNADVVRAVADTLAPYALPVVVDPVMFAKSGDTLLAAGAVVALKSELLPRAALVTPNLPEAEALFCVTPENFATVNAPCPILLKGGHGQGETVTDVLSIGAKRYTFDFPRLATRHTHGTGCTLSAAIAARLARGDALPAAVETSRRYLQAALAQAPGLGRGQGPLEHFPNLSGATAAHDSAVQLEGRNP